MNLEDVYGYKYNVFIKIIPNMTSFPFSLVANSGSKTNAVTEQKEKCLDVRGAVKAT